MKVGRGDLARLGFEMREHVDPKLAYLEGRELALGQRVRISLTAKVVETPSGGLIFGEFAGDVSHE
jgi:hypothetical protein